MTDAEWKGVGVMPTLGVADLDEAVAFYRTLGFRERWRYPEEGEGTTHAGLGFGDVTLMLARCTALDGRIDRQNVYLIMTGVREYHARLARLMTVPDLVESDYGMVDFAVVDPWGHLLTFGEEC